MKNVLLSALLICVVVSSAKAQLYSNADIKHHNIVSINKYPVNGYLEHLPPDYYSNPTKKYPMIVFLHGLGEKGDGSSQIYLAGRFGPSDEVEKNGKLCVTVNGKQECFIVISPQTSGDWSASGQRDFWDYILNGPKNYRYDPERIYMTGLSLGGGGVWNWAQSGEPLSKKIAAMAPIAGWGTPSLACNVALSQISVWGFHGTADGTISYEWGKSAYDALLQCNNVGNRDRKWSAIQGGSHFIWNQIYPTNGGSFTNPTLYEWFLSQTKTQTTNPNNQPPIVSVSGPGSLTLPTNYTTITATASDPDGQIYNYSWRKISGPSASLSNTDKATLTVTNMVQGTYTFEITVMDNDGATSKATANVVVNGASVANQAPTVYAGADKTVNAGSNIVMGATANDVDGWIAQYSWTKISGPSVTLQDQNKLNMTMVAPQAGTYEFQLKVTDDDGATAQDRVIITVKASGTFTVSAGSDITWDLNKQGGEFFLIVNFDIPGGWPTKIEWKKVSGPAATLLQTDNAKLIVRNFGAGTYEFEVAVTDNLGRIGTDRVVVTVTGSGSTAPPSGFTVSAGSDFTWNLDKQGGEFFVIVNFDIPGGWPTKIEWKKVSGPAATLLQTDNARLIVNNFGPGTYEFEVAVTDNLGRIGTDRVVVTVTGSGSTAPPSGFTVSAGSDFTWNLDKQGGEFFVIVNFDIPGGWPTKIEWKKVSGPAATLLQTDNARLIVNNFGPGTYEFEVAVTDNLGQIGTDRIVVTVTGSGSTTPPSGFTVSAGNDFNWDQSRGNFFVLVTFNMTEGWPTKIDWQKISGPAATLSQTDQAKMIISNASLGNYQFRVTVTDNKGRVASDDVNVVVFSGITSTMSGSDDLTTEVLVQNQTMVKNFSTSSDYLTIVENTDAAMKIQVINVNGTSREMLDFDGQVNLARLQSGMYIYQVITEEGFVYQKGRIIKY